MPQLFSDTEVYIIGDSLSLTEEVAAGYKDCGKRLADGEDDALGFSNGQSVSRQQVILPILENAG